MTAIHHQTNHAAFAKLLPGLMQKHEGKFAVMDTGHLVGLFKSAGAAFRRGDGRFNNGVSILWVCGPAPLRALTPGGPG